MEIDPNIQTHERPNHENEIRRSRSQRARQITPLDLPYSPENLHEVPAPADANAPHSAIDVTGNIAAYSGAYRNILSLIVFILHVLVALAGVGYFGFKGIQAALKKGNHRFQIEHWYPQLGAAAVLGAICSLLWQWIVLWRPVFVIRVLLWSSPLLTFIASLVLVSTTDSPSVGLGVVLLVFSIGQALYLCWVTDRKKYAAKMLPKALAPLTKFPDLHHPSYWVTLIAFLWIALWIVGVIGAISQKYAALIVLGFIVSLAWTMEVLRNIVNVTVSRVLALFYLKGMHSDTYISFERAATTSLGSISLGSFLVSILEALRFLARALNLAEGGDEFMFSCAHCCLGVMETIFRFGNRWAFVQVAAYSKGFVKASQDTWDLFQARELEPVIDEDLTNPICFFSGVASGALCLIVSGSWTFATHKTLTATVSLLSFLIGYFMTRITMTVPQACVCAYYVCFAENPQSREFDNVVPDRIKDYRASPMV